MKISSVIASVFLAGFVAAAPTKTEKRSTTKCGQYDSVPTGNYILYNDLWNEGAASSGKQCFTVDSLSGNTVAWSSGSVATVRNAWSPLMFAQLDLAG